MDKHLSKASARQNAIALGLDRHVQWPLAMNSEKLVCVRSPAPVIPSEAGIHPP